MPEQEHAIESDTSDPLDGKAFYTDRAQEEIGDDKLLRAPFAGRIADAIIMHRDRSSVVIGVYGSWGAGKTTVLHYVQQELCNPKYADQIVCMNFNPWRLGSEEQLLKRFFGELAGKLEESLDSNTEKAGEILQNLSDILIPVTLFPGVDITGLKETAERLSRVSIEDLKERLENILNAEGKRVAIFMDDIDRLDKEELFAVFRLIKLVADFDFTTYIMALDDKIVSKTLGERYPSNGQESGYSFLDKIVQVPLRLPEPRQNKLDRYFIDTVSAALQQNKINLSSEEQQLFLRQFYKGLQGKLHTPRAAKRYANALLFVFPILAGEVNIVDLMLIEGIRVFYPDVYDFVRSERELVIKGYRGYLIEEREEVYKETTEEVKKTLNNFDMDEKDQGQVWNLLTFLFPRLENGYRYGPDLDDHLTEEKRIASKYYFDRYFSLSLSDEEVLDQDLDTLIERAREDSVDELAESIRDSVGMEAAEEFVAKLQLRVADLDDTQSKNLALAISRTGDIFAQQNAELKAFSVYSRAGNLVSTLVENIRHGSEVQNQNERQSAAEEIISKGEPVYFAQECYIAMHSARREERLFSEETEEELGRLLAAKIRDFFDGRSLLDEDDPNVPSVLHIWARFRSHEETNDYLTREMEKNARTASHLLRIILSQGIGTERHFDVDTYEGIRKFVDPQVIYDALLEEFPSVESPKYNASDLPLKKHQAHQFAAIHQQVKGNSNVG